MQEKKSAKTNFSDRLKKLKKEKGVSQRDIANVCGVSEASASQWFNGGNIKAEYALILAKYFGVSTEYLLGLDSETMLHSVVSEAEASGDNDYKFNLRTSAAQAKNSQDRYFFEKARADRAEKELARVTVALAKLLKTLE